MQDYGINGGSTLHLMVLLCAVPVKLDNVVFDLNWGYPLSGRDYLDACAWSFEGQKFHHFVTYSVKSAHGGAIKHSGDVMDDSVKKGHHKIEVHLSKLPKYITHVYFTLSAWKAGNISDYRDPGLRFYEKSRPGAPLCKDETYKSGRDEAIVICSLSRSDDQWMVHSSGAHTDGRLSRVEPLLKTIQALISRTGDYKYIPLRKIHYSRSYRK